MKSKLKISNLFWWLIIGFIALMILIELVGDPVNLWLRYDRQAILEGQLWRLLTSHLVHLGWQHLLLNLAGLILTYLVFYRYLIDGQGIVAILGTAFGVSVGLLLFNPGLAWYVGLSGLLHGLLIFAAIMAVFDKTNSNRKYYSILLIVLLLIKIGYEQIIGPLPTSAVIKNYRVITVAHLYGVTSGIILAIIILVRRYLIQIKRSTD